MLHHGSGPEHYPYHLGFSRSLQLGAALLIAAPAGAAVVTIGWTLLGLFSSDPFALLVVSALVNGCRLAPFLIVTRLIARDRQVMGKHRNGKNRAPVLGRATAVIMGAAAVVGIWPTFGG